MIEGFAYRDAGELFSRGGPFAGRKRRPPWSPLDLGAKVLAWWTADRPDLMTLVGSQVSSWRDAKAGYEVTQATSAARPTYSATSFGGAPALTFDGGDDNLRNAAHAFPGTFETWGVCQQDAPPSNTPDLRLICWGGSTFDVQFRLGRFVNAGLNRAIAGVGTGGGNAIYPGLIADFSSRHVVRCEVGAAQSRVGLDAGVGASMGGTPVIGAGPLAIGAIPPGTAGYWQGKIRDIIVTTPLTTEEADRLRAWAFLRRML